MIPDTEARIKNTMSAVFGLSIERITDELSPDNFEGWDSLKNMNLAVALEEEFDISFTDLELTEMMNYSLIKLIVLEHLQND